MEKRLIIAIVLSIAIIAAYQFISPQTRTAQPAPPPKMQDLDQVSKVNIEEEAPSPELPVSEKETVLETDRYILTFSNIGGSIKKIELKEYTHPETRKTFELVTGAEGREAILSLKSSALAENLSLKRYAITQKTPDSISYFFNIPGKFQIIKKYKVHNSND